MDAAALRIVTSPSAQVRLDAAHAFVDEVAAPGDEIVVIGAPREGADELVRARTKAHRATFGLHRLTLGALAARLAAADLAASGRGALSSLGAVAMTARAVFRALSESRLDYFAPVARAPSFARAAHATLDELRRMGVPAEAIAPLGAGGRDLAELLTIYEEELESAKIADRTELFAAATRILRGEATPPLAGLPLLFLDVPLRSTVEARFVEALVARAPRALWTLPKGDEGTLARLEACSRARRTEEPFEPVAQRSGVALTQHHLFDVMDPGATPLGDGVELFSAPGEGREAVEIARRVLAFAERGVPFDEMAILVRSSANYVTALETALGRAGVPAAFASGVRRPHPSGRALSALVACAAERLSAARFVEYLSLGQVPPTSEEREPPFVPSGDETMPRPRDESAEAPSPAAPVAIRRWEALLVRASIVEGAERWPRRLEGLAFEIASERERVLAEDPDGPRARLLARDLEDLEALQSFALPIVEALAAWPAEATWGEWVDLLEALAARALRTPEPVLAVLAELHPMASVGPIGLDEVLDVIAPRLSSVSIPPPKQRYGRVYVASPEQARGRSFRVVFVPGLAERVFPQKIQEDPLLLDDARVALGAGLATQADRAALERLRIRLAVGAAREHLVVSYPRIEMGGSRARVPSLYALDVVRATTGRLPDVGELQRDAAAAGDASLAWPAPASPDDSIDETEHDLATLRGLLGAPASGRARYLLELNPHLARSLRARWARWHSPAFSRDDGLLFVSDWTKRMLAAERLALRARSVSALQRYAACPYQFYLAAILRLAAREGLPTGEELDPLTRGSLFHRVQAETMRELASTGALPVTVSTVETAATVLERVLRARAAEHCDELRPAIEQVFWDEIAEMRSDLLAWLHHVAETSAEWEPVGFEVEFGLRSSIHGEAVIDGKYKLHGAIDAVERARHGGALRVTDFKTGVDRTEPGLVVGGGEVLQPVLYGLALESLLAASSGVAGEALTRELGVPRDTAVREARLFFCTSRGAFTERTVVLDRAARAHGLSVLTAVDRAIESAFFPAYPRAEACERCPFQVVCGPHEEERLRRKRPRTLPDAERARELSDLRDLP